MGVIFGRDAFCVMLFGCLYRITSYLINFVPDGPPIICEMSVISLQETEFILFSVIYIQGQRLIYVVS